MTYSCNDDWEKGTVGWSYNRYSNLVDADTRCCIYNYPAFLG